MNGPDAHAVAESDVALLARIRACTQCRPHLAAGARPVLQFDRRARLLIAGQAPGTRATVSGRPFDDPSGARLLEWLDIPESVFRDPALVTVLPMGFCHPGRGRTGDLPPVPACARTWRAELMSRLPAVRLTVLLGMHAMRWHLPAPPKSLTEAVRTWHQAPAGMFPLPHPSPRNNGWLLAHPWYADAVLPALRAQVRAALSDG